MSAGPHQPWLWAECLICCCAHREARLLLRQLLIWGMTGRAMVCVLSIYNTPCKHLWDALLRRSLRALHLWDFTLSICSHCSFGGVLTFLNSQRSSEAHSERWWLVRFTKSISKKASGIWAIEHQETKISGEHFMGALEMSFLPQQCAFVVSSLQGCQFFQWPFPKGGKVYWKARFFSWPLFKLPAPKAGQHSGTFAHAYSQWERSPLQQ